MCQKCNNKGVIYKPVMQGIVLTEACTCEVAKQQEASYKERWNEWVQKFEECKRMVVRIEKRVG